MSQNNVLSLNHLHQFREWLLTDNLSNPSLLQKFMHRTLRIIYAVVKDLKNGQLSLRAMSLVYTTIIAIVPLLALSFSVLKGFGMHESLKPILLDAMQDLGDKRFEIVDNVMTFINNVNVGVLGAVGFAVLIYSVISMMHKIENAFNYTWQIARSRNLSHRVRDYMSVVFVAPLLIIISAVLTNSARVTTVVTFIESLPFGTLMMTMASFVLPYVLMTLGFAFVYLFIPNTRVRIMSALLGGLVTTIAWKFLGWGVANFVAGSSNNTAIYSAFASVIILMVWLYFCWYVLLIGASVAFYHQNYKAQSIGRENLHISLADREIMALEIMKIVGNGFNSGDQSEHPTIEMVAMRLGVSEMIIDETVRILMENNFLLLSEAEQPALFPQRPLEKIMLVDVLETIRHQVGSGGVAATVKASESVTSLLDKIAQQKNDALEGVSLAELD